MKFNYFTYMFLYIAICFTGMAVAKGEEKVKSTRLPAFTYNTLDGKKFSSDDLDKGKALMIVYFNPGCDLCQKETKEILDNASFFNNIQILMVSPLELTDIQKFASEFKLSQHPQITVLHDKEDNFYKTFNAIGYPSIYLYNSSKDLITYFEREVSFDELRTAFENNAVLSKK